MLCNKDVQREKTWNGCQLACALGDPVLFVYVVICAASLLGNAAHSTPRSDPETFNHPRFRASDARANTAAAQEPVLCCQSRAIGSPSAQPPVLWGRKRMFFCLSCSLGVCTGRCSSKIPQQAMTERHVKSMLLFNSMPLLVLTTDASGLLGSVRDCSPGGCVGVYGNTQQNVECASTWFTFLFVDEFEYSLS